MSTLTNTYDPIADIIFSKGLKIESAIIKDRKLTILLNTEQILLVSLKKYKRLSEANVQELRNFKVIARGTGIHWPVLDEDLSLYGFLKDFLNQNVQKKKKLVIA